MLCGMLDTIQLQYNMAKNVLYLYLYLDSPSHINQPTPVLHRLILGTVGWPLWEYTSEEVGDDDDDDNEGDSPQDPPIANLLSLFQQQVPVNPQPERHLPSKQVFVCSIVQPIIT